MHPMPLDRPIISIIDWDSSRLGGAGLQLLSIVNLASVSHDIQKPKTFDIPF